MKNKNSEDTEPNKDIHGRIESLDQSIRSVDSRLRAVEKRLSVKTKIGNDPCEEIISDTSNPPDIEEIRHSLESLRLSIDKIKTEDRLKEIETRLEKIKESEMRIAKLENMNKITVGSVKIPIEFSGLVAAIVLLVTGLLIYANQWGIVRSSYYPISLGILFGIVVAVKYRMINGK
jgi:hypothetical protein